MPAPIPGRRQTQIRINAILYEKVRVIAQRESRNINSQLEYFVKQCVERYELDNGPIDTSEESEH